MLTNERLGGGTMHITGPQASASAGDEAHASALQHRAPQIIQRIVAPQIAAPQIAPQVSAILGAPASALRDGRLQASSALLTALAVAGVIAGLAIAALLSRDPREAGAYAVACLMIGGAIAVGTRAHETPPHTTVHRADDTLDPSPDRPMGSIADTMDAHAFEEAIRDEWRAVAHDLKAPLLSISSYLDLIANGAFGDVGPEAAAALRRTAEISGRAHAVVESALREQIAGWYIQGGAEDGALLAPIAPVTTCVPTSRPVDLNATLSDVTGALTCAMRERNATVAVQDRLPAVRGDEDALFRIFENLVENAIKYCPAGRTPHVGVEARWLDGVRVEIIVADNGAGLPADGERLMVRGVRGENGTLVSGHGLGLATVARLVTRVGGTIDFERPREGGTRARVTLLLA